MHIKQERTEKPGMYHKIYVKTEGSEEQSSAFLKRSTTKPIETGRVEPGTLVYLNPRLKQCVEKLEIPGLPSTTRILFSSTQDATHGKQVAPVS